MLTNAHVWREAQERLRPQMTRAQFDTWLRGTRLVTLEQSGAVLAVRTTFAKELLESQYRERIEVALAAVLGRPCALSVVVASGTLSDEPVADDAVAVRTRVAARPPSSAHERQERRQDERALYARPHLFDSGPNARSDAEHALPPSQSAPAAHLTSSGHATPSRGGRETARQPERQRVGAEDARSAAEAGPRGHPAGMSGPDDGTRRRQAGSGEERARMHTSGHDRSPHDDDDLEGLPDEFDRPASRGAMPSPGASGNRPIQPIHSGVPAPRLNPRYTFKTFIVGSSNQLAYAASVAVGEAPGEAYNPLFLYGGVGLGKTHLLHAVGHAAAMQGLAVLYVTSETFTNEIVNAIRYRTTEEFRAKYRTADVLLVDDIQFIAGKDSTEEEFFHTFNSLYESGRQIVICSDHPPKAIVSLEERLRSRFEWGLIADVQPPDFGTRVAILRAKADMMQRQVPDDVIDYLADRIQSNIRELEGSLNRLLAFSTLQRQPLTVEIAKAALATLASDARARRISIGEVLTAVSEYYHISLDDLRGKQRDKHIVVPRQVAMYLMRQETESSLLEIGQSLGGRDHSTVLHGCEKIGREINENTALRKEIVAIRQRLLG